MSTMSKATVKQYSISLTSWFTEVIPFRESGIEGLAKKLLVRFGGYNLRPADLFQREGDRLFDYDLSFSLFNRSSSFRINPEGIHVAFHNARDEKDAGIIGDCLLGVLECISERRIREHRLETFLHASLSSAEERNAFLANLGSLDLKIVSGGSVFYLPSGEQYGESRFLIERSMLLPDGVFLNWGVPFTQTLTQQVLSKLSVDFKNLAGEIGLDFGNT